MVIRDLTLRSAASFGSFHLIRLLYDEYMFYLVEHRVAQATGETPIGVMGEVRGASSFLCPLIIQKDGKRRLILPVCFLFSQFDSLNTLSLSNIDKGMCRDACSDTRIQLFTGGISRSAQRGAD